MDTLHANLYLGFGRNMEDVDLYHLWHDENLNATAFLDASNPAATTLQRTSLFALGATLVAATKEVQFAALNPGSAHEPGPLANMRAYRFLQANGPGTMYSPYLKTVDGMVSHAGPETQQHSRGQLPVLCIIVSTVLAWHAVHALQVSGRKIAWPSLEPALFVMPATRIPNINGHHETLCTVDLRAAVDLMTLLPPQVAQATGNARKVQMELLVLLCLEGAGFMILAVILIIRLLRSISVHRQALFSVFLAVPHTYLRTLASKSVSIGDEDAEEEDGEHVYEVELIRWHYDQASVCTRALDTRRGCIRTVWLSAAALRYGCTDDWVHI
jgi:hypothetical protein